MKVCFYGNTGHFFTAFLAKEKLPEVNFTGYCPSFAGENMGRLRLFAGQPGEGDYPDGWEAHARNDKDQEGAFVMKEYEKISDMLDQEKPDILVVDGLFTERYEAEKEALQRGINVYADKPIAITLEELDDLYECVKQSGKILWAMDTVRYDPWYYTAKKLVDQGIIGTIRMVNCQKSYRFGERPEFYKERKYYGGTIPWVTIHAIDMIRMITGKECLSVYSQQSRAHNHDYGELEIITTTSLKLEDEILATISTDYYRPENADSHDDDRLRIVGTDGILEVVNINGEHEVRVINAENKGTLPLPQENSAFIFEDFVRTIQGQGEEMLDVKESFRNAYVAILAQQSADENIVIKLENAREKYDS